MICPTVPYSTLRYLPRQNCLVREKARLYPYLVIAAYRNHEFWWDLPSDHQPELAHHILCIHAINTYSTIQYNTLTDWLSSVVCTEQLFYNNREILISLKKTVSVLFSVAIALNSVTSNASHPHQPSPRINLKPAASNNKRRGVDTLNHQTKDHSSSTIQRIWRPGLYHDQTIR